MDDIQNRFTFHPPRTDEIADLHTDISEAGATFAKFLNDNLPETREKSLALTNLEQATMWANACVARNL